MISFKQMEAIFWIGKLGSFALAARKLCISQSAISKRIQELEQIIDTNLFDRSLRAASLTDKGEEMFMLAQRFLEQRDIALEQLLRPDAMERRVRIGITELSALTWLPILVKRIQARYPKVTLEPYVDCSQGLYEKVLADDIDLIFVPDTFTDISLRATPIGTVESAWMCKPGYVKENGPIKLGELPRYCLLVQGPSSGAGAFYEDWLKTQEFKADRIIVVNNLLALIGLTVSGLGISYLPRQCVRQMLNDNELRELEVTPPLPVVRYMAVYRAGSPGTILSSIVSMAQECCNFGQIFQTLEPLCLQEDMDSSVQKAGLR